MKHHHKVTTIDSDTDASIFCKHYLNNKKIKAKASHLFFFHDLFDYHKRYEDFVDFFSKEAISFNISFFDYPGNGLSQSATENNLKTIEALCVDFINQTEVDSGSSIYLVGQGLGALLILELLLKNSKKLNKDISGIILVNPMLRLKLQGQGNKQPLAKLFSGIAKRKLNVSGRDLTTDTDKMNSFNIDSLNRKSISYDYLMNINKLGYELRGQAYFIKVPVLYLLSEQDTVVDNEFNKLFLKGIDKAIVTMREYSKAKHDLLNEQNREEVFSDIKNWMV